MNVNDEVLGKIVDSLKKNLLSFHSHKRPARIYAKRFLNGFSDTDREFIIKEILYNQNLSIINAIKNKKNISVPNLGSFQYRESLEMITEIKDEVKKEMNIDNLKTCDPIIADKAIQEIEIRKKLKIIPLYFKQIGGKGSSVNHNFLKK